MASTGNLNGESVSQNLEPIYPAALAGYENINYSVPDLNDEDEAENIGALIAVGATNSSDTLASFSYYCGSAMNWCMVAPGENIISAYPFNGYAITSGTSMSAPQVSGAAAIILDAAAQNGTNLTSREVAEILLLSATDLGEVGVDSVYGHGLLNIEAAIAPVGLTSIPLTFSVDGYSVNVGDSIVTTSSAFGDTLFNSSVKFTVLDSFDRAYIVNLSDLVTASSNNIDLDNMVRDFASNIIDNAETISQNTQFALVTVKDKDNYLEQDEDSDGFYRMFFATDLTDYSVELHYNVPMNQSFYSSSLDDMGKLMDSSLPNSSILALIQKGYSYNTKYNLNSNSSISFGSFTGEQEFGRVFGSISQYNNRYKFLNIGVQFGAIIEEDSFLGSDYAGAFSLGENTPTWFYNLATSVNLSNDYNLFGSYNYGISFPNSVADSLFSDISQIESYSFNLGIRKNKVFGGKGKLDFVISQPLRVSNGSAKLDVPTARDIDGNVSRQLYEVNLTPTGREIDLGAFYSYDFSVNSTIDAGAMYSSQPGHYKDADSNMILLLKYRAKF